MIVDIIGFATLFITDGISFYNELLQTSDTPGHKFITYSSYTGATLITKDGWKLRTYITKSPFKLNYLSNDFREEKDLSSENHTKKGALKKLLLEVSDVILKMIERATLNNPSAQFKVMDCRIISALNTKYDAILNTCCLSYLSKIECAQTIKDSNNFLESGSYMYLSTMEGKDTDSRNSKPENTLSTEELAKEESNRDDRYTVSWNYLATTKPVTVRGHKTIGFCLPIAVLKKVYARNAMFFLK